MFTLPIIDVRIPSGFEKKRCLINSLPQPTIEITQRLSVASWELPTVHYCQSLLANKVELPRHVTKHLFLDHISHHNSYTPVSNDGFKSHAGVGFRAVLPGFTWYGRLPSYALIFYSRTFCYFTNTTHPLPTACIKLLYTQTPLQLWHQKKILIAPTL